MTLRKIRKAKQKLYEILNKECTYEVERRDQLVALAQELNALAHPEAELDSRKAINDITRHIHTVLQTEMMLNACVSAKRSCFLAAVAAVAACFSIILSVILTMCSK
jgi:hypothetical protein